MKRKIFQNHLLVGVLVLVLCCGLFIGVFFRQFERQAFDQLKVETGYIVHGIELSGADYLDTLSSEERVTWVDAGGNVLYDSYADASAMGNHLNREEIAQALEQGYGQSTRYSETVLERNLYYAQRLSDGTIIRVSCTQGTVVAMLLMLSWPIVFVALAALIVCTLLAYRLSRDIVKPINQIDLDYPRADETYPELAPLVDRIREQNRTIRKQMDELSQRQQEFSAITEHMSEGFFLVDHQMSILSANPSALRLLGGETIRNLTRDGCIPQVLSAVQSALAGVPSDTVQEISGRSWNLIADPVVSSGQVVGVVVMLVDVTEREQRERLRREFSANVSHELKTPLTSISGFAELMQAEMVPMEMVKEFAGDIYRESQRLIELVNDIIRLSKLDSNSPLYEEEQVDLYELSDEILANLRPIADKNGITLTLTGEHMVLMGVWQILNEMVYNLCDNAIKYNRPNGSVAVEIGRKNGQIFLTVRDTGIGIPYADQDRVFERFFRVDKSHSKAVGGTGLGLSIVKHGAQYHNARVELNSEPGKGTEISVIFEKAG